MPRGVRHDLFGLGRLACRVRVRQQVSRLQLQLLPPVELYQPSLPWVPPQSKSAHGDRRLVQRAGRSRLQLISLLRPLGLRHDAGSTEAVCRGGSIPSSRTTTPHMSLCSGVLTSPCNFTRVPLFRFSTGISGDAVLSQPTSVVPERAVNPPLSSLSDILAGIPEKWTP